ncbi:FCD domain-containing protein [Alkalihalobacillus oceani]|uniref:FadR/GntR family transcriptional regulator n=1 Tax=Halalkalibacter oceani TaxID=1653776 RepID=UPI00203E4571|nr:FCD domain-containing protein [Halalkalibacter oceani]MCM3762138.1 FCD domain-containing protein [Halalkalibacter oceani]
MRNNNDRFNQILAALEKNLNTGIWSPGDRLPTLPSLAKEFHVSVATVREVLRVLQSKNLISIEQGRGIFVNKHTMNISNDDHLPDFSVADLLQLSEVRSFLEPLFAETAAKQAFDDEIQLICDSAQRMSTLVDEQKSTLHEDLRFHKIIAQATHNNVWIEIYDNLQDKLLAARGHTNIKNMREKAAHYHTMIANAIRDRNPEKAKMYMISHMEGNRELALFELNHLQRENGKSS